MDEGDDDTGARVTNGMAEGDSTSVNVHFGSGDIENLLSKVDNNGESLVYLKQGDFVYRQASLLEGLGDGDGRSGGEINGVNAGVGIS